MTTCAWLSYVDWRNIDNRVDVGWTRRACKSSVEGVDVEKRIGGWEGVETRLDDRTPEARVSITRMVRSKGTDPVLSRMIRPSMAMVVELVEVPSPRDTEVPSSYKVHSHLTCQILYHVVGLSQGFA